jgi:uncharacterized protein
MNPITAFIKRHPQVTFWGINWLTWLFGWYMLSKYPSDLWTLFIYMPFLSGALITAIADGRSGLKTFFSRLVRWRVGLKWYAVALFLPLLLRLAAFGLNIISGAKLAPGAQLPPWPDLLSIFLIESFLIIALGEEPGFRGFALPRLLEGRSALAASLILGVLHAIWHIPLFIFGGDQPIIIIVIISGAVLNTWLFNKTNGSVLLAMLLHASINLMVGIFNPLFSGPDADRQTIWLSVVFVAMAILLPILTGPNLGRKPEQSVELRSGEQPVVAK